MEIPNGRTENSGVSSQEIIRGWHPNRADHRNIDYHAFTQGKFLLLI
jgi:dTDP-4-dehydrorhamnose 3,5-epimerase-like enzyme